MGRRGHSSNPGFVTFQLCDSGKVFISSVSLKEESFIKAGWFGCEDAQEIRSHPTTPSSFSRLEAADKALSLFQEHFPVLMF